MPTSPASPRIFLSPPDIGDDEMRAVQSAMESGWIAPLGPDVNAFEDEFAKFVGAPAAAALSTGTAALQLALSISGVTAGDVVLAPTLTFVATANAAIYLGAEVRFVDSERRTWGMDPDLLEEALAECESEGKAAKAVLAVDLYGQCCELDRILQICDDHGVTLIEDAAEALGASWEGTAAGNFGRMGAFSFNGNKIMTTSGGGMLIGTPEDMERARYLASQAKQPVRHYEHTEIGYNYRLSNLLAAMGRAQLANLPPKIERLHQINQRYREELTPYGLSFMPWDVRGSANGWLSVALFDHVTTDRSPSGLCDELEAQNIEARPVWKPMHLQPIFSDHSFVGSGVSEDLFDRGVCLPSGSSMTDSQQQRVIDDTIRYLS